MSKTEYIHVRVAPWEKYYITTQAQKAGMNVSDYVRHTALLKDVIETGPIREMMTELRRQGNNLNQLVVMARQGRILLVDFKPFLEVYRDTWQALSSLLSRAV